MAKSTKPWMTADAFVIACKRERDPVLLRPRQWIEVAFGQPIQTIRIDLPPDKWQAMYNRFRDTSVTKPDFRLELLPLWGDK